MGNVNSTNAKIHTYIDSNNEIKLLEYIKKGYVHNNVKKIRTHITLKNGTYIPLLNLLIRNAKCLNVVVPFLLQQNPNIYKKYNNQSCISIILNRDDANLLKMLNDNKLIDPYKICTAASIDFYMNTLHCYKVSLTLLSYCISHEINMQVTPTQPINILMNLLVNNNQINATVDNLVFYIGSNFQHLLYNFFLHDLFEKDKFLCSLSYHKRTLIYYMFHALCKKMSAKYISYVQRINNKGDTLLSCLISTICVNKYLISDDISQLITFLIQNKLSIHHINTISNKSIKDVLTASNMSKDFIKIDHLSSLFDAEEIFINDLKNGTLNLNNEIRGLYKNTSYTINNYTGTGLHHILTNKNVYILFETLFDEVNNINALDSFNRTFIDIMLQHKNYDMVKFLINNEAELNRVSTFFHKTTTLLITPLTYACCYLQSNFVDLLLSSPHINLNLKNADGSTALIESTKLNKVIVPLKLLSAKADSRVIDKKGKTVLQYAKNKILIHTLNKNIKVNDYYNPCLKSSPPDDGTSMCCKICLDNKIDILFYPCKHALCCNTCYKQLILVKKASTCSLCKREIDYVLDFML